MKPGQDGRRYPGAHSFDDTPLDRKLFFGRFEETKDLFDTILAERLVILYAKSGLGKTSLLNAGIKQALRDQDFLPLAVRLNNATARPMGALFHGVSESARTQGIEHRPGLTDSLWSYFKTTEFWRGDSLLAPVLILDQFEELFTLHDADQRRGFIEHLSELFRGPRQEEGSSRLGRGIALSDSLPVMKIVISMREDYLPSLEELATFIPGVLRTRFRLNPLSRESARSAIKEPATVADNELATPRFTFAEDIVEAILDLLSSRTSSIKSANGAIEPFQLQLICHHVEDLVRRRRESQGNSWPKADPTPSAIEIRLTDLGGISGIHEIIEEFYERQLDEVSGAYSRRRLERLCEAGLVNRAGKRLSLEEQEIASNFKIPRKILAEMSKRRILRAEPRLDSLYYELSHDILVDPVIASRTRRRHKTIWNWGRSIAAIFLVVVASALWKRHDTETRRELIDAAQKAMLNSDSQAGLIAAVDAAGRSLNLPGGVSEVAVALSTIMTKPTLTEASLGDARTVARAIASDGRTVLDATADGQVELHDRGGQMLLRMKLSVAEPPAVMTFNPDGNEFAVAAGSLLQAYDIAGNVVLPPKVLPSQMTALAFSSASDTLFAATRSRQVCSVALLGNSVDCSAGLGDQGDIRQLIFEASADRVLGLSEDGNVYQWQFLAGHLKPIDEAISRDNPSMVRGWVVSDDRTAVAATVGSTLLYWRGGHSDPVQILGSVHPERDGTVIMALSQDGSRLAVTAGDSDVVVFNMQRCRTPDCGAEYRTPYRKYSQIVGDRVSSLAWSKAPGSNQLAIGGDGVFVGGDAVPSIGSSDSELNTANGPPMATGRQASGTEGQNSSAGRKILPAGSESDEHAARALFISHFHQRFIAMAYFADGSLLTATADGDLDRWRPDRSHVEKFGRPISGSGYGHVTCLVTSPDNKFFLLGDDNTNFELWKTEAIGGPERTTDEPATRKDVDSDVQAIRLNWDGSRAVLVDKKQNVSQWAVEANDLRLLKTINSAEGTPSPVSPISRHFSGSGSLVAYYAPGKAGDLVVGTSGGSLRRPAGPIGSMDLAQLSDPIVSMDADAAGNLFLGTRGGWLLWRGVDTRSPVVVIPYTDDQQYQDSALMHIEHSKSDSVLITTSADEKVTVYRKDAIYSKLADFGLRTPDVDSVAVSADGGEIEFLTANRKLVRATLSIPLGTIALNDDRIAISPRDDFAVTLNLDQHLLTVFDPELRHPLWSSSSFSGRCEPSAFSIAPDGEQIVVGCAQGRLALVTPSGSAEPPPPTTLFDRDETITSINDFGSFFVGGSDKGRLAIWSSMGEPMQGPWGSSDLATAEVPTPSMFLSNPADADAPTKARAVEAITTSAIGSDGDLLAAGTARGELILWRIGQGKIEPERLWTRESISGAAVSSVTFSSGDKLIFAVYKDGEVLKYKADNGEESSEFHIDAHAGLNNSAFSAGGKYLVTTDSGGNVQIWNDDGRALTPAISVGSEPLDAAFRPDGESIALSRVKSYSPVVPSDPREWLLHACDRLTYSSEVADSSNQEAAEAHKICAEEFKRARDKFSDERLSDFDSSSQLAIGGVWNWLTGNRKSAGPTPLQQAAGEGRLKEVQDLASKGASVNERDLEGHTALTAALRSGYADVATYLISKGADYRSADKWGGVTSVHVAAASGLVGMCRELIDLGVPVDQADSGGVTPLMIASWRGDMALLRFLLSRNASVNKPDKFGRTPLIDAVQSERLSVAEHYESISIVGVLLDHGADVNQMTYFGEPFGTTALLLAKRNQLTMVSNRILETKPLIENLLPSALVRIDLRILPARLQSWAAPKIAGCSDGTLARPQQEQYLSDVTSASGRGDPDAEFLMGLGYAMGCGTSPDQMKARASFQAAAHNGSTLGEAAYGLSLWLAEGGSQPKDSGVGEIEMAASRGDPFGLWLDAIATRYDEQSKSEALSMMAAQAFAPAANSVASRDVKIPRRGLNEDRIKQMESYLQSGSERGDVTAMVNLGVFHAYTIRNFTTSIQDWKAAFAANDQMVLWPGTKRLARSDAAFNLGQAYHFGFGVTRSDVEAARWYEQAQDDREALEELAWMYEHGQGVPKSLAEAVTLYRKAAAGGSLFANARLASLNYGP